MKSNKVAQKKGGGRGKSTHTKRLDDGFNQKFEAHVAKLGQVLKAAYPPNLSGPRLFKEGAGGTLEQVGREADLAMEGVKRIMGLLNTEGKAVDHQVNAAIGWAGVVYNLSAGISQGSGDGARTGDSLKVSRIRCKLYFNYATADGAITVVLGRSKDGVPAIADIFDSVGTIYSGVSFENHDQREADKWLKHKTLVINNVDHKGQVVEFDISKLDVPTLYVGGSTTVASGCYWLAFISNQVASGAVYSNTRMDFVDN